MSVSFTEPEYGIFYAMDRATRVQILDAAVCISHCVNTLGKDINPIILSPDMGK